MNLIEENIDLLRTDLIFFLPVAIMEAWQSNFLLTETFQQEGISLRHGK